MASGALNYEPSGSQTRPWVRWAARYFDIFLFSFLTGIILELVSPSLLEVASNRSFDLFLLFIYAFVEPVMLCSWGTTPGKAILKVRLRQQNGSKLSYSQAFQRSFSVWIRGLGIGIPIVALFTLLNSYNELTKDGITAWDNHGKFSVSHQIIGPARGIIMVLLLIGGLLLAVVGSIGQ